MPVSDQQHAANRDNAARSTGPRTPQGKARSAQNARKHGFTASSFAVVRLEDLNEVAHLRDDLVAVYQPVNSQERFALERMAIAQQTLLRAAQSERHYRRALEEFERVKALRPELQPKLPNEPISEGQPEQNAEITNSKTNPFSTPEPTPDPTHEPPLPTPVSKPNSQPEAHGASGTAPGQSPVSSEPLGPAEASAPLLATGPGRSASSPPHFNVALDSFLAVHPSPLE